MGRIVSVWLIDWPVTVWSKARRAAPPDGFPDHRPWGLPFALIARTARGAVIHALNPAARAEGLSRGQTQADALAMVPHLICEPADPRADTQALETLALWCERWSPAVSIDASDEGREGLFMDMTGADHLFGGETAMLVQMRQRLERAGVRARLALAETPGAAWGLARYGSFDDTPPAPGPDQTRETLGPLPLEALRLRPKALTQARRFGLRRIADLYPLPRAGLARRFRGDEGLDLVRRLDQALGLTSEALIPSRAAPRYRAWEAHAEPLIDTAGVEGRLPDLADRLASGLDRDGQGARALTLTAFRTDGRTTAISVRTGAASRAAKVWLRLLRERGVERLELGFGVDALMLSADLTEPLVARQAALEHGDSERFAENMSDLIDRLSARLGEQAVRLAEPQESWLPERAERWRSALETRNRSRAVTGNPERQRPILLLDPPEPVEAIAELPDGAPARFTWRRASRKVVRADGPERLSPEWWRPAPQGRLARTRDYYRVEDERGLRYWLFREGLYGWDYNGEPEERAPSWWMHGMFP